MTDAAPSADPRRWRALFVIAIAQLMVILDASIVNIALPDAQKALGISAANRQWVVTAYTLAFGGLLLLGGRIADYAGRKRVFIIGLIGFAGASALGGFATEQWMLFSARALQGAFGAILAPAALSLISVTFTDSKERARAFGVYGALSGAGAAIGLIAGGLLTEYVSWRWCLFVNIPMALIAVVLALPNVRESRLEGKTRYDVPGALLSTAGFVAIVYGITEAATPGKGWGSTETVSLLIGGALLLVAFVVVESKSSQPLLPLRIVLDRVRGGSMLSQFFLAAGIFGMFLFMTFYFQGVHGFSPVRAGLCFLPFSIGIATSAAIGSQLLPRFGPRFVAGGGLLLAAGGLFYLSFLSYDSAYLTHVLPAMLMMSLGLGSTFVSVSATALFGVPPKDSGIASAMLNTSQQIGGSLGTAIFNTVAISATAAFAVAHPWQGPAMPKGTPPPDAMTHGFDVAFKLGALSMLIASIVFVILVNIDRDHLGRHDEADGPSPLEQALFEGATGEI